MLVFSVCFSTLSEFIDKMSQVTDDTCTDGNRDGRSPRTFLIGSFRIILSTGCYVAFADFYFFNFSRNIKILTA